MKQASWLDPRLLGGVLLILVSIVVGARVVAGADKTVPVYAAAADLPAGHVIADKDLRPVRVRLSSTATYLAADKRVVGQVMVREVREGELVAASALVAEDRVHAPFRVMSLSVKPDHLAFDVVEGTNVDVIATSSSASGGGRTWTVAKGLEVLNRARSSGGGFAGTDAHINLRVPAELVLPMTAAMRNAEIDVVRVPDDLVTVGDIGSELPQPAQSGGSPSVGPSAAAGAEPTSSASQK